ncbi:hypothetical protein DdX_17303 [Ditylenchus destructor]|uniref:Uncharacterized protein n=1 Tax=Ditylenchus destructor TaxID=166010 RepID=A0AAD4MN90_9BILA|nr:hypothetical protein DdX_17303 [Ditylenchus destructor]
MYYNAVLIFVLLLHTLDFASAGKIKVLFRYVGTNSQFSLPEMELDEEMTIGAAKEEIRKDIKAGKITGMEEPWEPGVKIAASRDKFADNKTLKDVYPNNPVYPDKTIEIHHKNHSTAGPGVLSVRKLEDKKDKVA